VSAACDDTDEIVNVVTGVSGSVGVAVGVELLVGATNRLDCVTNVNSEFTDGVDVSGMVDVESDVKFIEAEVIDGKLMTVPLLAVVVVAFPLALNVVVSLPEAVVIPLLAVVVPFTGGEVMVVLWAYIR
jgi:hypothetical protein